MSTGNRLGQIEAQVGVTQNNFNTATPFHIPPFTRRLLLLSDSGGGYRFRTGLASPTLEADGNDAQQSVGTAELQVPIPDDGQEYGLAIRPDAAAATVTVFAADGEVVGWA